MALTPVLIIPVNDDTFVPCDSCICAYCANHGLDDAGNCKEECGMCGKERTEFVGIECIKTPEDD